MADRKTTSESGSVPAGVDPVHNQRVGLLDRRAVRLDERAADRDGAIRRCGQVLVELGAVAPAYVDSMLERERSVPTYLAEGVAIPHATLAGKYAVHRDALAVLKFPDGVDWNGNRVTVCIAIAVRGEGHLELLAELADVLLDPGRARALRDAAEPDDVLRLLKGDSR